MRIEEKNGFFSISMLPEDDGGQVTGKNRNVSVFAGNLKEQGPESALEKKRRDAIADAVRVVKRQFAEDGKTDAGLKESRSNIDNAKAQAQAANEQIKIIEEERVKLKEEYGITDDSEQEKQLDIIRKAQNDGVGSLTDEENEVLASMEGYTDYQYRALALDAVKGMFQQEITGAQGDIRVETSGIRATKQALLEVSWKHSMTGASIQEDGKRYAIGKELLGAGMSEIKNHLDEELEKLVEEAKEREKEKQEQEEKLEKLHKKKTEMDDLLQRQKADSAEKTAVLEGMPLAADPAVAGGTGVDGVDAGARTDSHLQEMMTDIPDAQKEIQNIASQGLLLDEDLKGLMVSRFL